MKATRGIGIFGLCARTFLCAAAVVAVLSGPAASQARLLKGQTVYVPAYSHIYHGDREVPFYLTVTLSIRNTDAAHPITITAVDYFDSEGKKVRSYLEKELELPPLGSLRYVVKESDKTGGAGAKFLVGWKSNVGVVEPIVEAIMVSTQTQQGISFTSRGKAVSEVVE
ncbi:MAG: DUF3124 domain-containing protein [Syntrophobacteraceae bacterium]